MTDRDQIPGTVARWAAAAAIAVGGLIHLQLYFDGYRDFPNASLGRAFLLNAIASMAVAAVLVVRNEALVRIAGASVVSGTLIAFALSRTDRGVFGFTERGLRPSPQATLTLFVEIASLVLLAATFIPAVGPGVSLSPRTVPAVAGLAIVVTVASGALWARSPQVSNAAETPVSSIASTSSMTTPASPTVVAAGGTATTASGGSTTIAPAASGVASNVTTITIADFSFVPPSVEIPSGASVEWVNNDSVSHSIVSEDGSFKSETLKPGDRFTFEFTTTGTFPYGCGIHPSMTASIVVTG